LPRISGGSEIRKQKIGKSDKKTGKKILFFEHNFYAKKGDFLWEI
jgi:hypothetical protein